MSIRALQKRVRLLEEVRDRTRVKADAADKFIADVEAGVQAGFYDPDEMVVVIGFLRRWLLSSVPFAI